MKITLMAILAIGFTLAGQAQAAPGANEPMAYAKVLAAQGDVKMSAKACHSGDSIALNGVVSTGPGSSAKIELLSPDTVLQIAARSDVFLSRPRPDKPAQIGIQDGTLRVTAQTPASPGQLPLVIKTHMATIAASGADCVATVDSALDETEVAVLHGKAQLIYDRNPRISKTIPEGHRGKIGSRSGAKIAVARLSSGAIRHLEEITLTGKAVQ